jgi:transposase
MSRSLFWLSNDAWAAIEPHLPKNQPGARRVDDRRVISGIVHMLKCGGRWADCPAEYGPATTVYNRWRHMDPHPGSTDRRGLDCCRVALKGEMTNPTKSMGPFN